MNGIFDSHAHYTDSAFDADRGALLDALPAKGVAAALTCGTDITDSTNALDLACRYPYIYAAVGVHPHEAAQVKIAYLSALRSLLSDKKAVAVGEIGLDYHYDLAPRSIQKQVMREQLALALELDLPVIIHDREAHADTLEILGEYRPKGVVHCFSGSVETARQVLELGLHIGLGGAVTFNNAIKPVEVAAYVPADRLLVETDCPYMSPVPFRGKRCDSSLITFTAERLADIRGTTADDILKTTAQNASRLFGVIL